MVTLVPGAQKPVHEPRHLLLHPIVGEVEVHVERVVLIDPAAVLGGGRIDEAKLPFVDGRPVTVTLGYVLETDQCRGIIRDERDRSRDITQIDVYV